MSRETYTPDEFARLLSLPADHPDRRRAEADPRFEAWRLMHREFEAADAAAIPPDEIAWASAALAERVNAAMGAGSTASAAPSANAGRPSARRAAARPSWWALPALRPALAFAAVLIVAGGAWWMTSRTPEMSNVRGQSAGGIEWTEPVASAGEVRLAWSAVPGAEVYRLVFYRADLTEVARIENVTGTEYTLRADALPAGLASGEPAAIEVSAIRLGDAIATSRAKPIRVP